MLAMKLRMHFLGYIILFGVNALVVRGQFEDLRGITMLLDIMICIIHTYSHIRMQYGLKLLCTA